MAKKKEQVISGISNEELYNIIKEFEEENYTLTPTDKYKNALEIESLIREILPKKECRLDVRVNHSTVVISITINIIWIVAAKNGEMDKFKRAVSLADKCTFQIGEDLDGSELVFDLIITDAFHVKLLDKKSN